MVGLVLAVVGLVVAACSLVPAWFGDQDVPWPLFVGSFIYLTGAFLTFFMSKDKRDAMSRLRIVRLGFVGIMAVIVYRLVS